MQGVKFVVRWNDAGGNPKRKEYVTEQDARKARKWLEDNGAEAVDIALIMGGQQMTMQDKKPPTEAADNRQKML